MTTHDEDPGVPGGDLDFRALIEQGTDLVLEVGPDGKIVYISPLVRTLLGWTVAERLGRSFLELVHPDDLPAVTEAMTHAFAGSGVTFLSDYRIRHRDGTWRVFEARSCVQRDRRGRTHRVIIEHDVTARRLVKEVLQESEQRYRSLFEHHPVPLWVVDEATLQFLAVNQTAIEHYGYSREEFLGMSLRDIRAPEDVPALENVFRQAGEAHRTPGRWRHRRRDGSSITVEVTSHAISFAGRPARLALLQDVTARKHVEEERARLALAVEHAAEAIIITDPQGTVLYVNPACERISGYRREDAIGQNPRALKSGRHDEAFYRELWETLTAGRVWHGRFVNRRKDGTLFEADATISPVRDADGTLVSYVAVERDVTEEVHLALQLQEAQKMEAVGRLAGGVAHDFNNLLGVISGYTELLARARPDDSRNHERLDEIAKAAARAATLTRQLLAFSRRQVLQPKILDLNLVVADLENMLRRLVGEDVEFVTVLPATLGCVRADSGQLAQVLMNLAINARDAMPGGGRLTIETSNVTLDSRLPLNLPEAGPGPWIKLMVTDTGHGMDPETLAHAFEPFYTTKGPGQGTGLGLSTVYGIVKQSGGYVSVDSEPGLGTSFRIYLPQVEEVQGGEEAAPGARPPRGTEALLLVEDEEALRELLAEALTDHGYAVIAAAGGEEALRLAEAHEGPIHLVVTDVVMPGMSGRELVDRLVPRRPEARILYLSGYASDEMVRHGVLDPGASLLTKPFSLDALLAKVREVLDGEPSGVVAASRR